MLSPASEKSLIEKDNVQYIFIKNIQERNKNFKKKSEPLDVIQRPENV